MNLSSYTLERIVMRLIDEKYILYTSLGFGLFCSLATHLRLPLPWTPVPITFQPLGAFLAGALLGPVYGLLSQLVYLLTLPLSIYKGYGVLGGPLVGYLISITLSSALVGSVRRYTNNILIGIFVLCALAFIYTAGLAGLAWWYYTTTHTIPPLSHLLTQGVTPFIWGDLIKVGITLLSLPLVPFMFRRVI